MTTWACIPWSCAWPQERASTPIDPHSSTGSTAERSAMARAEWKFTVNPVALRSGSGPRQRRVADPDVHARIRRQADAGVFELQLHQRHVEPTLLGDRHRGADCRQPDRADAGRVL